MSPEGFAMQFNLMFPMRAVKHYRTWIAGNHFADVGRIVEDSGFHAVAMSEHPFPPNSWLARGGHHALDPLVALAQLAAATSRIRLVTYLLVSSYRNPYVTAKALSTLDTLSNGRVIAGIATGYLRGEFAVLGAEFAERGRHVDAAIPAMRAAWAGKPVTDGPFPAAGHTMLPPPEQAGGPPIWLGGNSAAARRRAARLADGWAPIAQSADGAAITGTVAIECVHDLNVAVDVAQRERAELGKAPLEVAFSPFEKEVLRAEGASRFAAVLADRLADYAEAGVTWLTIELASRSFDAFRTDVCELARVLRPG
jgi:probable F420-dependent oxidoreductase